MGTECSPMKGNKALSEVLGMLTDLNTALNVILSISLNWPLDAKVALLE
jgi:hypothetical protein